MSITAADLVRYRAIVARTLTDTCVNDRTGLTSPCRVFIDRRQVQLAGMPSYLKVSRRGIVLPDSADVEPNDVLTVTGQGAGLYAVYETGTPESLSSENLVYVIKLTVSGSGVLPYAPNATVNFRYTDPTPGGAGTIRATGVPVFIEPLSPDEQIAANASMVEVLYIVAFPAGLTYLNSALKVGGGASMQWPDFGTTWFALRKPVFHPEPLPYLTAVFSDKD
jgi:hypothetical protein